MLKYKDYSPKKHTYHIFYPEASNRTILQKNKNKVYMKHSMYPYHILKE